MTANGGTSARLTEQIDFDASPVFRGEEIRRRGGRRLLATRRATWPSGTLTWAEALGEGLEVPARLRGSL